jgi:pSer/pThr/pTyr-binding forkhead associated (FHA) protein
VPSSALGADPRLQLQIHSPTGRKWTAELTGHRMTIGRPTPDSRPDIPLEPDPMRWVSRDQCELQKDGGRYYLCDNRDDERREGNPTRLRLAGTGPEHHIVTDRIALAHGDVICIRGLKTESKQKPYDYPVDLHRQFAEFKERVTLWRHRYQALEARVQSLKARIDATTLP